jgi:hypothetical protein
MSTPQSRGFAADQASYPDILSDTASMTVAP